MLDPKKFEDVVRRLGEGFPEVVAGARSDVEKTIRLGVQQVLASMEVVTREEFEVQRMVLSRTRERLEALEKRVAALEALHAAKPQPECRSH